VSISPNLTVKVVTTKFKQPFETVPERGVHIDVVSIIDNSDEAIAITFRGRTVPHTLLAGITEDEFAHKFPIAYEAAKVSMATSGGKFIEV
jgi:hypothetical protein